MTIVETLNAMGYPDGWAADHAKGIIIWTRDEPQPTEEQIIAAGWIKPTPQPEQTLEEETPTE